MTKEFTSSGHIDHASGTTHHYGVTIRNDEPTTGVLQNNEIPWLHEEMMDGIDLSWEEYLADFEDEHGREPTDDERDEASECSWGDSTYLIGDWAKDADGKYVVTLYGPKGFSAIVGEIYTQVVWSKTTIKAALCSPCFPGQADIGTPGDHLAFTLPADMLTD